MTTTEAPAPAFRYIGITDETTVCEHCGRTELHSTIVLALLDAGGVDEEFVRYGSTCAARALAIPGGGAKVYRAAAAASVRTVSAAAEAIEWLTRKHLTRDGQPDDLAVKLGVGEQLLANIDGDILAARVAAVRDAAALGVVDPAAWLKRYGYA